MSSFAAVGDRPSAGRDGSVGEFTGAIGADEDVDDVYLFTMENNFYALFHQISFWKWQKVEQV